MGNSTIFVSNLPYSATSTDINTLFSDIGPVRSAFVVLDPASGSSKGVGYVAFAIREDAQLAFDKVNEGGEGIILDNRKLRVQWAGLKPLKDDKEKPVKDGAEPKERQPIKHPKAPQPTGPRDPLAIRTIVVSGLPSPIDSNTLWKKMRKYDGAQKVEWPANVAGVEDKSTAHVLFSNPATAEEAVNKLHAHVYKSALLSVTLKKRLDGLSKPFKKPTAAKVNDANDDSKIIAKTGPAPSRASRLIIRNLPWNITEQDLRAVFLPYGPIHSVHIPVTKQEHDEEGKERSMRRAKGYAFVWMLSKKDAEKALEGANGTKMRSGMADGLVKDKQKRKKLRREEAKLKLKGKEKAAKEGEEEVEKVENEEDDEIEREGEDESLAAERVIAVDWALSKDKWEEAKAKIQEDVEQVEDGTASEDEDEDSHIGLHEDDEDESGSEPSSDEEDDEMEIDDDENPGKPQLPPPETGTTLFVRNVPFEATEDELRTVFRAFGPLRYARITLDHDTGRSRGTGFACFWNKEDADKAIEQSDILRRETGGETSAPKKNPFKLPSLLTPDPSASVAQNLVLHGRTMDVIRAVTRDEAGKLKQEGKEVLILPNTPAAEGLNQAEVEKRTQSFNARRALLRSNPSLFVSTTRLSIRQLPLFVTERMLKRLAIHAVRTFQREFKAGVRSGLTEDELADIPDDADDEEEQPGKGKGKGPGKDNRKKGRNTGVRQAKIVRQQDRVDPVTGKGRSRGYGFLEMEKHADALRVLRWANNNAEAGKLFDEWWKEELEDLIKAEKKKEKKEEGRLERMKAELAQGPPKKIKGSMIVEFSIENIQVVKRRAQAASQQEHKTVRLLVSSKDEEDFLTFIYVQGPPESRNKKDQQRISLPQVKEEGIEKNSHERKKRRLSDPPVKQETPVSKVGSLIGRKRKEKKAKRKQ
ncbi:hypothetical protein EW026_g4693 [Hermanssonia centrifuga]|uniref:RRM domain-containing protein n=1 Tax=Hermanssonia centrifuga TaxID=98765 RepID=A0A4S4KKV0_9APHY|nr:hypothetical protein EW026_g4693 [Hermanssonia centrifuga]